MTSFFGTYSRFFIVLPSIHGFAPTDGKIIYKDPTRELSDTDEPQVSFTAEMFPGITADD